MAAEFGLATPAQVKEVLQLLVSGVTSDATSMEEIAGSWWRRFLFLRWFGPRLLGGQMDTFVACREGQIVAFLIVQYDGEAAGTFDWAFLGPLTDPTNKEDFSELIDTALDHIEEQGQHDYFYFGFATDSPPGIRSLLKEIGLHPADYQMVQMKCDLPLEATGTLPDNMRVAVQLAARFGNRMEALLPVAYPDEDPAEVEMITTLHKSTLRSSKILQVEQDGEAIGFVQEFRWRDELRLLLALPQRLWGTEEERQIVLVVSRMLQGRSRRLRIRTLSQKHLEASRDSLAGLGLRWELAPWQRWIVQLEQADPDETSSS